MNDVTERIKEKFIICYDEITRPAALSLKNSITAIHETCVVWSEEIYNQNECKLTNHNLLVLLNEKMIKQHLANPAVKTIPFSKGIVLKHEGNTLGLMFDISQFSNTSPRLVSSFLGKDFYDNLYSNAKRFKSIQQVLNTLLFDAVGKLLKEGTLEKFLRGEELD